MKKFILLGLCCLVAACSTLSGNTVGQDLFAAYGAYDIALTGAVNYAEAPTADKHIVHALNEANEAALPAAQAARAYAVCHGKATGTAIIGKTTVECSLFSFTPGSLTQYAIALRATTATLAAKQGN